MATSKSAEAAQRWGAGAYLFSGRPDPEWILTTKQIERLLVVFDGLEPTSTAPPEPPGIGYRGCFVRSEAGHTLSAFREVASWSESGRTERRSDPQRFLERSILSSAPAGCIPSDVPEG